MTPTHCPDRGRRPIHPHRADPGPGTVGLSGPRYRQRRRRSGAGWSEGEGDLVITDVVMPDENGLDLIPRIRKIRPDLRVVVMSAQSTLMTAVKATQRGAFEYLPKPFDLQELLAVVGRALAVPAQPSASAREPRDADERLPLIGRSPAMQEVYKAIGRVATSDVNVLVHGESGTGKELVARSIYHHSRRSQQPFVAINCAAIPEPLLESELFGHERGAFTGADRRRIGKFRAGAWRHPLSR